MTKKEAFKIVYDELTEKGLFIGKFDAKHGNVNFMYGIELVMEYISYYAECNEEYEKLFMENFRKSLRKEE